MKFSKCVDCEKQKDCIVSKYKNEKIKIIDCKEYKKQEIKNGEIDKKTLVENTG